MIKKFFIIFFVLLFVNAFAKQELSEWSSGASNLGISLNLPKLYYVSVENSNVSIDVEFAVDHDNDEKPTITLNDYVQEIASISSISNDSSGYSIKIVGTNNNFTLQNNDAIPVNIPYSLQVDTGDNYAGSSNVNSDNSSLITIGAASDLKKLYVKDAKIKIHIPSVSGLVIDDTTFSDTLTISIVAD